MDRKFYPENFERFLRGHTDQFKMSPSKKVWHGIYNDLHPGRRWPSIAMSMLFIFTLVIIGHLNTNNGRTTGLNDISTQSTPQSTETKTELTNQQNTSTNNLGDEAVAVRSIDELATDNSENSSEKLLTETDPFIIASSQSPEVQIEKNTANSLSVESTELPSNIIQNIPNNITSVNIKAENIDKGEIKVISEQELEENNKLSLVQETVTNDDQTKALNILKAKTKNNVSWAYYFTPSLGYRFFSDENMNNSVMHQTMFGHEAGTAMNIKLFKNLELTSGLQLNYSGYSIKANNTHPVVASLMLNEPGGVQSVYSTMSHYGNSATNDFTKLKNYSLQASVPIGLQYMFAESDNFKLGASASFQPTFVIANNAFLLSTDKKNYLTNSDVVRNWNMNTSLSTYISFAANSLNWQIGPQVRYQLLSTYNKRYPITENLINYGIRVGISKSK